MNGFRISALLLAAACGDFSLVDPKPVAPFASMTISVNHDTLFRNFVLGYVHPGVEHGGRARPLADSALYVNGEAVFGHREPDAGGLLYQWMSAASPGDVADSVFVHVPVIAGAAAGAIVRVRNARRNGAQHIVVVDEDLLLPIVHFSVPSGFESGPASWDLTIGPNCGGVGMLLRLNGSGTTPIELRIPREMIAHVYSGTPLRACLIIWQSLAGQLPTAEPKSLRVSLHARFAWTVEVTP